MLIGIMPNFHIADAGNAAEILGAELKSKNIGSYIIKNGACGKFPGTDMIISIGGDGTYLHTARYAVEHNIPVLGMNMGHLGFLTQFDLNGTKNAVELISSGKYTVENRFLEDIRILRDGAEIFGDFAINDLVLLRKELKLIQLEIHVDESYASTFYGDGLIAATPTGSTAYSLSAGGPIIEPESGVMVLTPVCPHSVSTRPMVVSEKRTVHIKLVDRGGADALVTVDGENVFNMTNNDEIVVRKSEKKAKVVKLYQTDFYKILREKFL